jgi:hypothetical protein
MCAISRYFFSRLKISRRFQSRVTLKSLIQIRLRYLATSITPEHCASEINRSAAANSPNAELHLKKMECAAGLIHDLGVNHQHILG